MAELLKANGWRVLISRNFLDLEEGKKREIDIIAIKEIGKIKAYLIIECKQSERDDWVFTLSGEKRESEPFLVRHSPQASDESIGGGLFKPIHFVRSKRPIATNYVSFDKHTRKKSDESSIYECMQKLPKEAFYILSKINKKTVRYIFFPTLLFSGSIFSARYRKNLEVKKEKYIEFITNFDSTSYELTEKEQKINRLIGDEPQGKEKEIFDIKNVYRTQGGRVLVNVVSRSGFSRYLKIIEDSILKVDADKWVISL